MTTTLEKALETVRSEKVEKEEAPAIDFSYFLPVNIVFGSGKVKKAGELTKPYGKKALIVTGRSSAKKSGIYDKVKDSLEAAGLTTVLYDKVSQNPLTTTAEEGAAFAKENHCDVVVAIGGGSIMDLSLIHILSKPWKSGKQKITVENRCILAKWSQKLSKR